VPGDSFAKFASVSATATACHSHLSAAAPGFPLARAHFPYCPA